jgi:hypothetical protein
MSTRSDVLGVSDDELLKMPEPTAVETEEVPAQPEETPETTQETPAESQETPEAEQQPETPAEEPSAPEQLVIPEADPEKKVEEPKAPEVLQKKEAKSTAPKPTDGSTDYKAAYERIMAPIKAAGKTIQLTSVDEAVGLMQKGADYTRKMQELGKDRRFVMMLGSAGLLDEAKLDRIIAVSKGDKEALKSLLQEQKIDPVDIDTSKENKYQAGTHVVSDSTAKLDIAIQDLRVVDGGDETLSVIRQWDADSRQVFGQHPELLEAIHQQRLSGVYAKITAEVDRRRALGQLPDQSFLMSYKAVGDEFLAQGKLGSGTTAAPKAPVPTGVKTPAAPVARRPASPPPNPKAGNPAARAAAATRTTPTKQHVALNPMAGSDDEFVKVRR